MYPTTPDGRHFVVRGLLWRKTNRALRDDEAKALVAQLMEARRGMKRHQPPGTRAAARLSVDAAKRALGERGPVWWTDGAPDYNRKLVANTPYAAWFASLTNLKLGS